MRISMKLPLIGLAFLAAGIAPSLAQQGRPLHNLIMHAMAKPSTPLVLSNYKVFHFGTVQPGALHLLLAPVQIMPAPSVAFDNVVGMNPKYTLTPANPVVPGFAALNFSSASGHLLVFNSINPPYVNLSNDGGGAAPFVMLSLNGAAGTTYLIDANVYANYPNGFSGMCEIDVAGPDGSKQTFSCANQNGASSQDVNFVYQAGQAGNVSFSISTPANMFMLFYSMKIAAIQ